MRRGKLLIVALCFSLSIALLTGCGSKSDGNNNNNGSANDASGTSSEDSATFGTIESIDSDNNTITIRVMTSGFSGKKPENMPEDFTGDKPENMPAEGYTGEKPDNMPKGESKTYTVSKDAEITDKSGNKISLSGLGLNSFIQFTVDGDEIQSISVTDSSKFPSGFGGQKPEGKTGASEATTEESL